MRVVVLSILAGALLLYACSSSDEKASTPSDTSGQGDGGAGAGGGGVPDPSGFFETLPASTPDKLRGVWENTTTEGTTKAQLRLGFGDQFIGVALRCTPASGSAVDVNDVVAYDVDDVDGPTGQFDYAGINEATDAGVTCGVSIPEGIIDYAVTGTTLKLSRLGEDGSIDFTKVGDL